MDLNKIFKFLVTWLLKIGISFNNILQNSTNILTTMQVIGLTLIAVIIPMAIAVFQKKERFEKLDKHVFLDFVIKSKRFLLYIGMIFIPLLLWGILPSYYRLFETLMWLIGIVFVIRIIISSYMWIKGNTNIPRLAYLKKLKNKDDMEVVWMSLWAYADIKFNDEIDFFRIFVSKIDKFFRNINKNSEILSKLFLGFFNNIKNRTIIFISNDIAFKVFKWDLLIWQAENNEPKNKNNRMKFFKISNPINRISEALIKRNLTEGTNYALFDFLVSFVNENKKEKNYLDRFFNIFYMHFFDSFGQLIKVSGAWDDYFPESWKITKKNLRDKNNYFSYKTFQRFYKWAQLRILSPEKKFDEELDEAVKKLFPNVDPTMWSKILIFCLSGFDPNNRCNSIINKNWNFGDIRIYPISTKKDIRKIQDEEAKETFDLALILFKEEFSADRLSDYVNELEKINKFSNTGIEEKKEILLNIFRSMQDYISKK